MQSPRISHQFRLHLQCLQQQLLLTCVLLLTLLLVQPCRSSDSCSCSEFCADTSNCLHGLVRDVNCECCDVCASGPGELCGGTTFTYPACGEGLRCMPMDGQGLPPQQLEQLPGTCQPLPTTPPQASTSSTAPSTANTSTEEAVTESTTLATTEVPPVLNCRNPCSPSFCDGKARVCSARGLEDQRNPSRNDCQHTSCHACILLIRPQCDYQCGEPPTKSCLREFYKCVRSHYLNDSTQNLTLKLDDPRAISMASRGRVICHVPSLSRS